MCTREPQLYKITLLFIQTGINVGTAVLWENLTGVSRQLLQYMRDSLNSKLYVIILHTFSICFYSNVERSYAPLCPSIKIVQSEIII